MLQVFCPTELYEPDSCPLQTRDTSGKVKGFGSLLGRNHRLHSAGNVCKNTLVWRLHHPQTQPLLTDRKILSLSLSLFRSIFLSLSFSLFLYLSPLSSSFSTLNISIPRVRGHDEASPHSSLLGHLFNAR